jgi:WhiB family redox-sensing transcriptional regulator
MWMEEAACRTINPGLFYPERGETTEDAKKVCRESPVRTECLELAGPYCVST